MKCKDGAMEILHWSNNYISMKATLLLAPFRYALQHWCYVDITQRSLYENVKVIRIDIKLTLPRYRVLMSDLVYILQKIHSKQMGLKPEECLFKGEFQHKLLIGERTWFWNYFRQGRRQNRETNSGNGEKLGCICSNYELCNPRHENLLHALLRRHPTQ